MKWFPLTTGYCSKMETLLCRSHYPASSKPPHEGCNGMVSIRREKEKRKAQEDLVQHVQTRSRRDGHQLVLG